MGSPSVSCHLTQLNVPHLNSIQMRQYLTYPPRRGQVIVSFVPKFVAMATGQQWRNLNDTVK